MSSTTEQIKLFFSGKKTTVAIIALVIASRILQLVFFYNIRVDGMYQVLAMQNLVHGHGISIAEVVGTDLSQLHYRPLINWPPGYSLILAPFYLLFGHNYVAAGITVDILFAVILLFACRNILKTLGLPLYLINIYTLLSGFFIYYFYLVASSDAIAVCFFAIAINYALLLLKNRRFPGEIAAGIILPLFMAGLIKYLFIPLIFILPVYIWVKGYAARQQVLKRAGLISFIFLAVAMAGLLFYQKTTGGSATYISEPTRGFFPGNLQNAYPFFPASFVQPDTAGLVLPLSPAATMLVFRAYQVIHVVLLAFFIILAANRLIKRGMKNIRLPADLLYLGFFLALGIVSILTALSLRVAKEENIPGMLWTYIEEPRYYGLVNVMIHLAVFALYLLQKERPGRLARNVVVFLLLMMLPEMFRGMIFDAKRLVNLNKETYSWQTELRFQHIAADIIKKEKNEQELVVVTGSSYYLNYRIGLSSHVAVLNESARINDRAMLPSTRPLLLLVLLQEKELPLYGAFMAGNEKKLAGQLNGFYFYTLHVNPH